MISTHASTKKPQTSRLKDRESPVPSKGSRNDTLDRFIARYQALPEDQRKSQEEKKSRQWRERQEKLQIIEATAKEQKAEKKRKDGHERVKRYRERQRQGKVLEGNPTASKRAGRRAKRELLGAQKPTVISDAAELSRPDAKWDSHRNGTKGGVVLERRKRKNYFHPFLWCHIDRVARQCNFSATFTAKQLSRDMRELYGNLSKSTVHGWLSKHGRRWSSRTMMNVERRRALPGKGRTGFLAKYPEIVDEVKTQLVGLRKTGISVNRVLGRAIFLAVIEEKNPSILDTFKCSEVSFLYTHVVDFRRLT